MILMLLDLNCFQRAQSHIDESTFPCSVIPENLIERLMLKASTVGLMIGR
jgi:hypothetical protein